MYTVKQPRVCLLGPWSHERAVKLCVKPATESFSKQKEDASTLTETRLALESGQEQLEGKLSVFITQRIEGHGFLLAWEVPVFSHSPG